MRTKRLLPICECKDVVAATFLAVLILRPAQQLLNEHYAKLRCMHGCCQWGPCPLMHLGRIAVLGRSVLDRQVLTSLGDCLPPCMHHGRS